MRANRTEPKIRKNDILRCAVELAETIGYQNVTRDAIANVAQITPSLISKYFGTMTQLKRALVRSAIKRRSVVVVSQALGAKDPHALKIDEDLKKEALLYLVK